MRFRAGWAALVFLLLAASCTLVQRVFAPGAPPARPFNHQAHLERGLDCATCHETAEKEVRAGMPARELCMNCHEDLDKDPAKPLEKKIAYFLDAEGKPRWSALTKQSPEIRFSHAAHASRKVACGACHSGMEKDTGLSGSLVQRMSSCTACHERQAPAQNGCSACHTRLDPRVAPASHGRMWETGHGLCSRLGPGIATANNCALCHERDACAGCHQTRPPKDHGDFFRIRGHGLLAGIDRSRCAVCHTSDSCVRCHESTSPASHRAGWNAPTSRHCASCHVPVQTSGSCFVCHKTTPGHDAAPSKPAWHTPAMNCRSCHTLSLRHPDNGDSCNACHR